MRKPTLGIGRSTGTEMPLASWVLLVGLAVVPIVHKYALGPIKLSATDLCLVMAAGLSARDAARRLVSGALWSPVAPALPLLAVVLLSGLSAANRPAAAQECAKLVLYLGVGGWLCARASEHPRWRSRVSDALAVSLCLSALACSLRGYVSAVAFTSWWGTARGTIGCVLLTVTALAWLRERSGGWRGLEKAIALFTLLAMPLMAFAPTASVETGVTEPVSQRVREGYAAVSVLAKAPLFGLGPGNYQEHIGEYYQGMPKENTMANGTQIGYAVLTASLGLLGLAGYLYWLWSMTAMLKALDGHRRMGAVFIAVLVSVGLFTPVTVAQILMPAALMQGVMWRERRPVCAPSD